MLIQKITKHIFGFIKRINDDQVGAFAAQSSFFVTLSLFPFTMLILNIISFTPVTKSVLLESITDIVPNALDPLIISIIEEMYSLSSGTLISITAIVAVWSAGKGVLAAIRGFNQIYHIEEKRNYFHLRFVSSLYTILLLLGITLSLVVLVFGNSILNAASNYSELAKTIISTLASFRFLFMPIVLTFFFILVYRLIPTKKYSFLNLLPGAAFSALGWIIFSTVFSYYIDNFAGMSYMYGSLTTFIFLMLWIYIGFFIIFIGCEINLFFKNQFDRIYDDKLKIRKNDN